jgi:3-phosphoshikimate 1-carboxyvinyltransferase
MSIKEINPVDHIDASLRAPGSNGHATRSIICAALAEGTSVLRDPIRSLETTALIRSLVDLGYDVHWEAETIRVEGRRGAVPAAEARLDVGDAAGILPFLAALLSLGWGRYELDGEGPSHDLPVGGLTAALGFLGGGVTTPEREGRPPLVVEGAGLAGGRTTITGEQAGTIASAVLLVSPLAENPVVIEIPQDLESTRPVDLSLDVMSEFGMLVDREGYRRFRVPAGRTYRGAEISMEGDAGAAAYFFAAAAITGGRVRIENLGYDTPQEDIAFVDILDEMGCRVEKGDGWMEIHGGDLRGIEVDLRETPDLLEAVAVTSLFARDKTTLRGARLVRDGSNRRLASLRKELRKVGAATRTRGEDLIIQPQDLKGAEIETHQDHRIAMAFALVGLCVPGIRIRNPSVVSRSFPGYFEHLEKLGQ